MLFNVASDLAYTVNFPSTMLLSIHAQRNALIGYSLCMRAWQPRGPQVVAQSRPKAVGRRTSSYAAFWPMRGNKKRQISRTSRCGGSVFFWKGTRRVAGQAGLRLPMAKLNDAVSLALINKHY